MPVPTAVFCEPSTTADNMKCVCLALTVPAQPCPRSCCRVTAHQEPSTVPLGPCTASLGGTPRGRACRKPARSSRTDRSDLRHLLRGLAPRSVGSTQGQPSRPESFATSAAPTYSTHSKPQSQVVNREVFVATSVFAHRSKALASTSRRNSSVSSWALQSISGQRSISREPSVICTAAIPPRHSVQKL